MNSAPNFCVKDHSIFYVKHLTILVFNKNKFLFLPHQIANLRRGLNAIYVENNV